jgi:hypothetical protein
MTASASGKYELLGYEGGIDLANGRSERVAARSLKWYPKLRKTITVACMPPVGTCSATFTTATSCRALLIDGKIFL